MFKKEKSGGRKRKKGRIFLIVVVVLLLGAAGYVGYDHFFGSGLYREVAQAGDVLSNGEVQIVFSEAEVFTEMDSVAIDPDYVYVKLCYEVTNLTESEITWRKYPYVSVNASRKPAVDTG
jgi:flagellar basal body-associated protein FliL